MQNFNTSKAHNYLNHTTTAYADPAHEKKNYKKDLHENVQDED